MKTPSSCLVSMNNLSTLINLCYFPGMYATNDPQGLTALVFKILFISRERGKEGERERNINVWLPLERPQLGTWHLAHNPGMCPDWELNRQAFGSESRAQSTEPHQPG